jgi:hypothetical protein
MDRVWSEGCTVTNAEVCEKTGWPIDIVVQQANGTKNAVYFLLNEELCFNAETEEEEPLGL